MICLNSAQAASDLLDKRGSNYCDRPRFALFEVYVLAPLYPLNHQISLTAACAGWDGV
jgi:hypothetical protein